MLVLHVERETLGVVPIMSYKDSSEENLRCSENSAEFNFITEPKAVLGISGHHHHQGKQLGDLDYCLCHCHDDSTSSVNEAGGK